MARTASRSWARAHHRLLFLMAVAAVFSLTSCGGVSIGYLRARLQTILARPAVESPAPGAASTPLPTRLVTLETPSRQPAPTQAAAYTPDGK